MESFMSLEQSLLNEKINRISILRGEKEQSLVVGKNKLGTFKKPKRIIRKKRKCYDFRNYTNV